MYEGVLNLETVENFIDEYKAGGNDDDIDGRSSSSSGVGNGGDEK